MALRNIVQDGDPILKKVCRPVTEFNEKLAQLLDDMGETMVHANGLGLAGPQVGMLRRVFVVLDVYLNDDGEEEYEVIDFVNPEILETSEETVTLWEGCLSYPDRNGDWFEIEAEGMLARAILHENDHLNGITVLDKTKIFYEDLTPEQRKKVKIDDDDE